MPSKPTVRGTFPEVASACASAVGAWLAVPLGNDTRRTASAAQSMYSMSPPGANSIATGSPVRWANGTTCPRSGTPSGPGSIA